MVQLNLSDLLSFIAVGLVATFTVLFTYKKIIECLSEVFRYIHKENPKSKRRQKIATALMMSGAFTMVLPIYLEIPVCLLTGESPIELTCLLFILSFIYSLTGLLMLIL